MLESVSNLNLDGCFESDSSDDYSSDGYNDSDYDSDDDSDDDSYDNHDSYDAYFP